MRWNPTRHMNCQSTMSPQVCNTSPHWAMSSLQSCCPCLSLRVDFKLQFAIYNWHITGMCLLLQICTNIVVSLSSLYIPVSLCYGLWSETVLINWYSYYNYCTTIQYNYMQYVNEWLCTLRLILIDCLLAQQRLHNNIKRWYS